LNQFKSYYGTCPSQKPRQLTLFRGRQGWPKTGEIYNQIWLSWRHSGYLL